MMPLLALAGSLCQTGNQADRRSAVDIFNRTVQLFRHHQVHTREPVGMDQLLQLQGNNYIALGNAANRRAAQAQESGNAQTQQQEAASARREYENARAVRLRQIELFREAPLRNSPLHALRLADLGALGLLVGRPAAETERHFREAIRIIERHPANGVNGQRLQDGRGRALVGREGQYLIPILRGYSAFLLRNGRRDEARRTFERAQDIDDVPGSR
jgi:hypothetical protein